MKLGFFQSNEFHCTQERTLNGIRKMKDLEPDSTNEGAKCYTYKTHAKK